MKLKYTLNIPQLKKYNSNLIYSYTFAKNTTFKNAINIIKRHHSIPKKYVYYIDNLSDYLWEKYSTVDLVDYNEPDYYYDMTLDQLQKEFNIFNKNININFLYGIGASVGEVNGIVFFFHTNEKDLHHIPHIHCKYGYEEYRINLLTLEPIDKKIFKSPTKNRIVNKVIKNNQETFVNYWNDIVYKGIVPNFKKVYLLKSR